MIREFGRRIPFAIGPGGQQQGTHRGRLPHAQGGDIALDILHGIIDGHAGGHRSAGGIDIKGDVLVRIIGLQKQELGDDDIGHVIVHSRCREK